MSQLPAASGICMQAIAKQGVCREQFDQSWRMGHRRLAAGGQVHGKQPGPSFALDAAGGRGNACLVLGDRAGAQAVARCVSGPIFEQKAINTLEFSDIIGYQNALL